ncbi:DUF3576 domain-containing protein [Alphaproteobacteria bacterium]|nr:DUF3576 domain-containing protein [Alphaproteobacteria bacterium]
MLSVTLIRNIAFITLMSIMFFGCGKKHQDNLKRLDEVHGVCDNPGRILTKRQYEICKMKERGSAGDSLEVEDISTSLGDLIRGQLGTGTVTGGSTSFANRYLWQASLEVLSPFPIKIADNGGGYIETDWIVDYNQSDNKRCQIKIMVRSSELVSNGLKSTLNCQNFDRENWNSDKQKYPNEEKNITLRILEVAQMFSLETN